MARFLLIILDVIIFLYGPDTFRAREKLNSLKEKFIREVDKSGFNLAALDGEKISIDEFNKAVATQSFLAKKRMIVARDVFKRQRNFQTEVLEILKKGKYRNGQDGNVIIFWDEKPDKRSALFKYLAGSKFKQEFELLLNNDLVKWTEARVKQKGGRINLQNASLLASKSDGNLWALANEIDKLIAMTGQGEMTKEDIEESVLFKIDDNIFNLCDAIALKNKTRALKLINDQLAAGINEIYLLTMIVRQFRILIQVRAWLDQGEGNSRSMASKLGLHPFAAQKAIPQASKYALEDLKKIYNKLLEIDVSLKLGQSGKTLLELFILEI
ncbi:DNA polymerase III subunit delta [Candidatus Kuenenbacteria bacterium RIFCSPHIGHO2_02_FULL_39_13]|uniref:DNA polymerase III subunit delta n=1 Tax=Candidatus Kuenenbacteria bacterium RIFCSPHIGHO2_02_FULL_39_13 TaxID=1798561 RepID=A0A1F6FL68_9BACT|nr:MAG: DNA polymerase III subunit delta [Candidatus Kuenenbacteria bacterium RIFCSPHIGHO2_02_FULL_39_13]